MRQSYTATAGGTTGILSDEHRRVLVEGSGIDPGVIAERGVRTVRKGRGQLPSTYSRRQKKRAPGILFTVHRPSGQTATIFRPDEPDPENPGHKYEQESKHYGGSGNVLDVHPSIRHLLASEAGGVPVVFVEGVKKADSIISAARAAGIDLLVVAISGVWNWMSGGEPIPDMLDVPVKGRRALICFDSDMLRKPNVQDAAERLAEHLTRRGAALEIVYLPDQEDGSKTGADDFLASEAGGSLSDLLALARPYKPGDLQREKLSRNEKLRRSLDFLTRRGEEMPSKSRRDCSKRAAFRASLQVAEKRGKLVEDGIEVILPIMTGAEIAAVGKSTFANCLTDLVEEGLVRRIRRERSEHADRYVLLVPRGVVLGNDGEGRGRREGEGQHQEREVARGFQVIPPLPEMRWSSPGRKPHRGVVKDTRRVRQGTAIAAEIEGKRRTGKKSLEMLRYLVEEGGSATREDLLERFGGERTTWRDFKKQTLAALLGRKRRYRGQDLSLGPPLVELTEEGIRLVDNWQEALELHRELGQEEEAAAKQKRDHMFQRIAYRKRNETPADHAPSEEEMDEDREARKQRQEQRRRIDRLVEEGMSRRFATEDVIGADGFIEDLSPAEDPDPPPPAAVEEEHPLHCECLDCSSTMPRYVTLARGTP